MDFGMSSLISSAYVGSRTMVTKFGYSNSLKILVVSSCKDISEERKNLAAKLLLPMQFRCSLIETMGLVFSIPLDC